MKRVLLFLLVLLLLTGCVAPQKPEMARTEPVAEFTKPESLYVADSMVEQQTAGAVKVFAPKEYCSGIAAMDGKIVLVTELSKLILMDSETGELGTSIKVGERISTESLDFTANPDGVTYYREEGRELVTLSNALQQKNAVEFPENISGHPCVSRINQEAYYAKDNELWAQHLQTGETRQLFGGDYQKIAPVTLHLNDTILACNVVDEYGTESMLYLDVAAGAIAEDVMQLMALQSGAGQYLVHRMDGMVEQMIYGTMDGERHLVQLEEPIQPVFSLHGGYRYVLAENGLELDFYDFITGTHSSHVRIEGVTELLSVTSDSQYLWILAKEGTEVQLYRWDVTKTPTGNTETFLAPLYTRENPDVQGLEQCAKRAKQLTEKYALQIKTEADVTGGFDLTQEHQVPVMNWMLDELEAVLSLFPEGFLAESLSEGSIHISLVRSISGGREVAQFYERNDAHIVVAATEDIRQNILHGLAYVIDSHVLGGSWVYDDWKDLNPDGVDYDYNYYFYADRADSVYLTNEKRAFVDAYAMTFPHEDRCLLLAYAMMDGNSAYFTSDTMQAKLSAVCQGIRDAYDVDGEDLPWEQYLAE